MLVNSHLLSDEKKGSSDVLAATLDQALRPTGVGLEQVHRRDHVQEHPLREEVRDRLVREPGHPLRVFDELAETAPHDLADLEVVAGRVRLHLRVQIGRIGRETVGVGLADRPEGVFAGQAGEAVWNIWSVPRMQRATVAMKSCFFVPKSRKTYGCEMPTAFAIASVEPPSRPRAANSTSAASRISSRRSVAVFRSETAIPGIISYCLLTCQVTSGAAPCRGRDARASGPARRRNGGKPSSS